MKLAQRLRGHKILRLAVLSALAALVLVVVTQPLLATRPPMGRSFLDGVSFVTSVPSWRSGRGPFVDVMVDVKDCHHTAKVVGRVKTTPEYWHDRADALRGTHKFAIAAQPTVGPIQLWLERGVYGRREALRVTHSEGYDGATVAVAPLKNWRPSTAIAFSFELESSPRSIGTCYIELPDLTSDGANDAGGQGLGEVFLNKEPPFGFGGEYGASLGRIAVESDGVVDVGLSNPPADELGGVGTVWTCHDVEVTRALSPDLSRKKVVTPPGPESTCNAQVVISEPNFAVKNNVALLFLGALTGILASLLLDMALEYLSSTRQAHRSPQ